MSWDFGRRWAWCSADNEKPVSEWTWGKGDVGDGSLGERMYRFKQEAIEIILRERPDAIAYEEVLSARGRGASLILPQTGLVAIEAEKLGLFFAGINATSLKKFATGRGNADKPDMLASLLKRDGWREVLEDKMLVTNDEIDAIWVANWAMDEWEVSDG